MPFRLVDVLKTAVDVEGQMTFEVAFPKFGVTENKPVVPSLTYLSTVVFNAIDLLGRHVV